MRAIASTYTDAERKQIREQASRSIRLEEQEIRDTVGMTITGAFKSTDETWTLDLSDGSKLVAYPIEHIATIPSLSRIID